MDRIEGTKDNNELDEVAKWPRGTVAWPRVLPEPGWAYPNRLLFRFPPAQLVSEDSLEPQGNHSQLPSRTEDPIVQLIALRERRPARRSEFATRVPGGATNRLRPVMHETPSALQKRAVKILPTSAFLNLSELTTQPLHHVRQLRSQRGITPERSGDRLCFQRRNAHLIEPPSTTEVGRLPPVVPGVTDKAGQLLKEWTADTVKLPDRGVQLLFRDSAPSWIKRSVRHGSRF